MRLHRFEKGQWSGGRGAKRRKINNVPMTSVPESPEIRRHWLQVLRHADVALLHHVHFLWSVGEIEPLTVLCRSFVVAFHFRHVSLRVQAWLHFVLLSNTLLDSNGFGWNGCMMTSHLHQAPEVAPFSTFAAWPQNFAKSTQEPSNEGMN